MIWYAPKIFLTMDIFFVRNITVPSLQVIFWWYPNGDTYKKSYPQSCVNLLPNGLPILHMAGKKHLFGGCMPLPETNLVWWFRFNPFEKYMRKSNLIISPTGWTFQKYLSCHHPATYLLLKRWIVGRSDPNAFWRGPIRIKSGASKLLAPFSGAVIPTMIWFAYLGISTSVSMTPGELFSGFLNGCFQK